MALLLTATFLVALLFCADSAPWIARIARRRGFLDLPGPRKIHTEPVPYGGGIAVALGVLLTVGGGLLAAWLHVRHGWFANFAVSAHAPGVLSKLPTLAVYGAGSIAILLVGLADDRWKLSPGTKLAAQFLVALGTVAGGDRLSLFWERSLAGDLIGGSITVLWIVGITNAFNLLDHMDGLSAGTALLVSAAFGTIAVLTGQVFLAAAFAALAGSCLGFLLFNFPPARIFLGDAGSLFIGYWLSVLTVSFTFYTSSRPIWAYAVPLVVFAVPIFDTGRVVLLRLRERRPIFQGDTNHVAHRLVALGMSRRGAVLTVYALTLVTGLGAVLLYQVDAVGAGIILSQLAVVFGIITLLEVAGRNHGRTD
ncbi:MAG: undecaprenyl/decaprenyl-phosphate alpha-N-acetylglucosaminyl 1-phosphate transferase [Planctomycetes bacterium]|nr:undecaprenyl/decaprenyl-phosphate alpha-N-acetylglucosaminyl 1-phosphate transferase [Planctomycetota bacterium]